LSGKLVKILAKSSLGDLVDALGEYGDLYAPVKTSEKAHSFMEFESLSDIDLSYTRTMIPPTRRRTRSPPLVKKGSSSSGFTPATYTP